jgi:outer membrane lipoprotein LolB
MTQTKVTLFLALAALLLLSSCATRPAVKPEPAEWQARQAALSAIDSWNMRARIGMRSRDNSGSATLIWDENSGSRYLRLLGPLGGGVVHIEQDASGASIRDSKGKTWQAEKVGTLIYKATGWNIPVSGLRWWMLGLTEPGSDADYTLDDSNRLQEVRQQGWKVSFNRYAMFDGNNLPSSLTIETDAEPGSEFYVRVKLIVKEWNLGER